MASPPEQQPHPGPPGPPDAASTRWRKAPVVMASVSLGAGFGLIFPVLAEFQDRYGFSTVGLGLISSASFVSALVSGLLLAQLADRGRARLLLVGGLVLSALGLLWFAAGSELWQFVGARVLEGLGAGVYFPAARRVVTAESPTSAGHNLGVLTAAEHGGFLLGPAVGAFLAQVVSLPAPFLVIGASQLLLAGWVGVVRLPDVPERPAGGASFTRSLVLARRPPVAGSALLCLALFIPIGVYDALWSRYLTDRGASTAFIGLGLSLYAVPGILLAPWGGRLADRYGPVRCATAAVVVIVPIVALYGLVAAPLVITAVAVLESLPQAVAAPSVQTAMLRASGPADVSAGQGLATSVEQVGAAAAALVSPLVYERFGAGALFVGTAAVVAVVFAAGLVVDARGTVPTGAGP